MRTLIALLLVCTPAYADDDPKQLAEAGWTAYQKHDLDKAEKLTRQAIAASEDPDIKGPALYNLGRVLEDRKDKPGAIAAYRQSFEARHNGTVRQRLGTLDPAAAAELDTFKAQPMQGPFATLEAYCKHWLSSDALKDYLDQCAAPKVLKAKTAFKLPAAIQSLELRALYQGYALLVVKVGGQLYVQELRPFEDSGHCHEPAWTFTGVTPHGAALEVGYEVAGFCGNREETIDWHEHAFTVIGVGASNKPSALPELDREIVEVSDHNRGLDHVYKATWAKDGSSVDIAIVKATGEGFEGGQIKTEDIKGHHALAFP
jgi:tetratricopeptide (TPR) repeat protein